FIAIARYQPFYKLNLEARIIYDRQGLDSNGYNFGSNIFLNYDTRPREYGFKIGSGIPATSVNAYAAVSYEIKENLFLELSAMYRTYTVHDVIPTTSSSTMFTAGIRLNMF